MYANYEIMIYILCLMIFIHIIYDDTIDSYIMIITYENFYNRGCIPTIMIRHSGLEPRAPRRHQDPLPQIWTPPQNVHVSCFNAKRGFYVC